LDTFIFQIHNKFFKKYETRLKIASVVSRVDVTICTQCSKSHCNVLQGKLELNCRPSTGKSMQYCMTAVKEIAILPAYGRLLNLPSKAAGQGYWAWLPGMAAGQGCRAWLPGKAAGQGCRARLPCKAAGQGCRARLPGNAV
jgi:hypothetical protein